jgi:hypothetical protein
MSEIMIFSGGVTLGFAIGSAVGYAKARYDCRDTVSTLDAECGVPVGKKGYSPVRYTATIKNGETVAVHCRFIRHDACSITGTRCNRLRSRA